MFNIGKILLFVVTMITSAAFLFFIPQIHIQIDWASLVTHHRIKVALTLLSPIIFGTITAYIAYQQHRLSKTQANISRDQRDIAHNKQRIENYETMYEIYNENVNLYKRVLELPIYYPKSFQFNISDNQGTILDLIDSDIPDKIIDWAKSINSKEKIIQDIYDTCLLNREKSRFMLDDETLEVIYKFIDRSYSLYKYKIKYINHQICTGNRLYNQIINDKNNELEYLLSNYTKRMIKYMDIRDIISPRKFE